MVVHSQSQITENEIRKGLQNYSVVSQHKEISILSTKGLVKLLILETIPDKLCRFTDSCGIILTKNFVKVPPKI